MTRQVKQPVESKSLFKVYAILVIRGPATINQLIEDLGKDEKTLRETLMRDSHGWISRKKIQPPRTKWHWQFSANLIPFERLPEGYTMKFIRKIPVEIARDIVIKTIRKYKPITLNELIKAFPKYLTINAEKYFDPILADKIKCGFQTPAKTKKENQEQSIFIN